MSKLTKAMIKAHKRTILEGFPDAVLSRCLGVSSRTFRRWRAVARAAVGKRKRDLTARERLCVEFTDLHRRGQTRLISKLWNVVVKAAEGGDWKAARWLLSVLSPEDFSNRGIAVRAVQRDSDAVISAMTPAELQNAIERESLEIILCALRGGDLQTALVISKSTVTDAGAFSPEAFLQGLRALKKSILNGDGGGDGDGIERQLMEIESERA